jgi:hypothetical protein
MIEKLTSWSKLSNIIEQIQSHEKVVFRSHEKVEFWPHEIRPPDPQSKIKADCMQLDKRKVFGWLKCARTLLLSSLKIQLSQYLWKQILNCPIVHWIGEFNIN